MLTSLLVAMANTALVLPPGTYATEALLLVHVKSSSSQKLKWARLTFNTREGELKVRVLNERTVVCSRFTASDSYASCHAFGRAESTTFYRLDDLQERVVVPNSNDGIWLKGGETVTLGPNQVLNLRSLSYSKLSMPPNRPAPTVPWYAVSKNIYLPGDRRTARSQAVFVGSRVKGKWLDNVGADPFKQSIGDAYVPISWQDPKTKVTGRYAVADIDEIKAFPWPSKGVVCLTTRNHPVSRAPVATLTLYDMKNNRWRFASLRSPDSINSWQICRPWRKVR